MRDALQSIVERNGQMVARGDFLAREDDIAPAGGIGGYFTRSGIARSG
jgi:hypothetical protein